MDPVFEVSVVVVAHNGRELLPDLLQSLRAQTLLPGETLVVDNASTDGTAELVRSRFPEVTLIPLDRNLGFAGGVNAGWSVARGSLIALINSDCVAEPRWLEELARAAHADPDLAAVVPKILRASDGRIEQAGAEFNQLGHCWTRGWGEVDSERWNEPREVAVLTGCSALLRRDALAGEEPFDPAFFMYYEELDLSLRLRERGLRIVYQPASRCVHRGMESVRRAARDPVLFQQFHCNRNRMKIVFRYFPWPLILRQLPLLVASVGLWNVRFFRRDGIRLALRAAREQTRFAAAGIAARRRTGTNRPWLRWMTRQSLSDIRALGRIRGGSD